MKKGRAVFIAVWGMRRARAGNVLVTDLRQISVSDAAQPAGINSVELEGRPKRLRGCVCEKEGRTSLEFGSSPANDGPESLSDGPGSTEQAVRCLGFRVLCQDK